MYEKSGVFASFFGNLAKTTQSILIKKIVRSHGVFIYKKALITEHRKIYILRDFNYFVEMSFNACTYNLVVIFEVILPFFLLILLQSIRIRKYTLENFWYLLRRVILKNCRSCFWGEKNGGKRMNVGLQRADFGLVDA